MKPIDPLVKAYFNVMFYETNGKFIAPLGVVSIKTAISYLTVFSYRDLSHDEVWRKMELSNGN